MTSKYRNLLAARSTDLIRTLNSDFTTNNRALAANFMVKYDRNRPSIFFQLPSRQLKQFCEPSDFVRHFPIDDNITSVDCVSEQALRFSVNCGTFSENIISTTVSRPEDYQWSRNALFPEENQHVLVEFSSPNIAKPFHIGHFRSTIIGNFVSNINRTVGNEVTTINYLGDWGTQFGLLLAGLQTSKLTDRYHNLKLSDLLSVYINANTKAQDDTEFADLAQKLFRDLENGDADAEKIWSYCRNISIEDPNLDKY